MVIGKYESEKRTLTRVILRGINALDREFIGTFAAMLLNLPL